MIENNFQKMQQAVNRPSNTDSIFDNYSMPQNVYDQEDYVKNSNGI